MSVTINSPRKPKIKNFQPSVVGTTLYMQYIHLRIVFACSTSSLFDSTHFFGATHCQTQVFGFFQIMPHKHQTSYGTYSNSAPWYRGCVYAFKIIRMHLTLLRYHRRLVLVILNPKSYSNIRNTVLYTLYFTCNIIYNMVQAFTL